MNTAGKYMVKIIFHEIYSDGKIFEKFNRAVCWGSTLRGLMKEIEVKIKDSFPDILHKFQGTGVMENREGTISEYCKVCGQPYSYHDKEQLC